MTSLVSKTSVKVSRACSIRPLCQTSPWSDWSICREDEQLSPSQRRTRSPTMWSNQNLTNCGRLVENRACNESVSFVWQVSSWSKCKIEGERSCGDGYQTRTIFCGLNSMVNDILYNTLYSPYSVSYSITLFQVMEESLCEQFMKPQSSKKCRIKCASKCTFTQWSVWSNCQPDVCDGSYIYKT